MQLIENLSKLQALVLVPTREIATAVNVLFTKLGQYMDINTQSIIYTKNELNHLSERFIESIEEVNQIIIGPVGRILSTVEKTSKNIFKDLQVLIIDGADEIIERGFFDGIKQIISYINPKCQICIFSQTFRNEIIQLSNDFLKKPIKFENDEEKKLTITSI